MRVARSVGRLGGLCPSGRFFMRQPSPIRVPEHFLLRPINYNEHCSNCLTRAGKKSQKVVKLCENADRAFEQVQRARFVRRRPSGKQTVAPNVALLLIRARYYDPLTGEFTSRDPLEYVDGMSLYRGYMGHERVDPSGLACDQYCCSFKGNRPYGGLFGGSGMQTWNENVKAIAGKTVADACKAKAKSEGWTVVQVYKEPCRGSGVCNVGQKSNVRATGIAYLGATFGGHPRDNDLIGTLDLWVRIISLTSVNGGIGAVDNIAGTQSPGASDAGEALSWLNKIRNRTDIDMNLWVKVEGECCKNGYWSNSFEEHTYWFNCSQEISTTVEPGKAGEYLQENLSDCLQMAKQAFDCARSSNNAGL